MTAPVIVEADLGLLSLLPVVLAMVLAFATKDAVFSLIDAHTR